MIEPGTKVIVHAKTEGCSLKRVFNRRDEKYPKSAPFIAWTSKIEKGYKGKKIYTLHYEKYSDGGDYYSINDFTVYEVNFFEDKEFLI